MFTVNMVKVLRAAIYLHANVENLNCCDVVDIALKRGVGLKHAYIGLYAWIFGLYRLVQLENDKSRMLKSVFFVYCYRQKCLFEKATRFMPQTEN
jgi:hypothetical protein